MLKLVDFEMCLKSVLELFNNFHGMFHPRWPRGSQWGGRDFRGRKFPFHAPPH